MKTVIGMSVLVVAGLVVTGFGFSGARDYLQVVVQRTINWAQTSPPLPVEIERLQLILGRLDSQLGDHQRVVAEASVDLERVERDVARQLESHGRVREKMVSLRDQLRENHACPVSIGGRQYPRGEAIAALRSHVEAYKAGQRTLEAQETALQHLRTSHAKLAAKLDDWKLERDRVQNSLLVLRSEYDAQRVSDRTEVVFEDGDIATARQLIDRIERRLQVEQKLRDLRGDDTDSLDVDSFDSTGGKPAADVLREVDRLLDGGNRPAA